MTGQIAHIHGRKGPRFHAALTTEEVRDYSNLVVLCQPHHKLVDDHPSEWSADQLREMKYAHEEATSADVFNGDAGLLSMVNKLLEQLAMASGESERERWRGTMRRESVGRCVASWLATGLDSELAWRLAEDEEVGAPSRALLEHVVQRHTTILTGEMGIGKSLLAERLLQRLADDESARLPVFVEARVLGANPVRELVRDAQTRTGAEDVLVVVDGLDESPTTAETILREVRAIAAANPGSRFVLTSRQMPYLQTITGEPTSDVFPVPPLDDDAASALAGLAAERPVNIGELWSLPKPVRSAAHRPLFALLLGLHLKHHSTIAAPHSPWALLQAMIEHTIPRDIAADLYGALMRLAADLTDTGAPVPVANHAPLFRDKMQLLSSRFVVQYDRVVDFSLDALTVWFAAQSVLASERTIESIAADPARLERWLDALRVIVVTGSEGWVQRVFGELVPRSPAAGAALAHVVLDAHPFGTAGHAPIDPHEVGTRVLHAISAWIAALRPRGVPLGCVTPNGDLRPLGYRYDGARLLLSWNDGAETTPALVELGQDTLRGMWTGAPSARGWPGFHSRGIPDSVAWEWALTFDVLRDQLARVLKERRLTPLATAQVEHQWRRYQRLARGRRWHRSSLEIRSVIEGIHDLGRFGHFSAIHIGRGEVLTHEQLNAIDAECQKMLADGRTVLEPPWPRPDRDVGPFIWSGYSTERFVDMVEQMVRAAMDTYVAYVDAYFPQLANSLALYQTLPAKFVGSFAADQTGHFGPTLSWHWEPLAVDAESEVNISVIELDTSWQPIPQSEWDRVQQLYATLRPGQARRLSSWHDGTASYFLGRMPVTELVYEWLWNDLRDIHWLKDSFNQASDY